MSELSRCDGSPAATSPASPTSSRATPVGREASPGDRRAWIVRLTAKGKTTFAAMAEEHERWIRELFTGLDADAVASLHAQLGTLRVHLLDKLNPSETEAST